MKNVYDLLNEKRLKYIVPLHYIGVSQSIKKANVAIIIHLHYYNDVEYYFSFVCKIPEMVDVYVTYSDIKVRDKIEECSRLYNVNLKLVQKENRGRDISALLVACREIVLEYEYVCFLHDKKEKDKENKENIDKWIRDLWENSIGSSEFIFNIIDLFDRNPQIGLLVPPQPSAHVQEGFYKNYWYDDFENTCKLAQMLDLDCDLDIAKPPISLGTVFWCRVQALRKLFVHPWKYNDFMEEPLPNDGTLSHAIERILPYVAQDSGFDTGMVLSDEIALEKMSDITENLQKTYFLLNKKYGISEIEQLEKFCEEHNQLFSFMKQYSEIYIYGAGTYGRICLNVLKTKKIMPKGFVVSQKNNEQFFEGLAISELSELNLHEDVGIVISVGQKKCLECIENIRIKNKDFKNYIIF